MQRIWIYQANRKLTAAEWQYADEVLSAFTDQWKAHGTPLAARSEIRYQQFIILMVDDAVATPSGCSIDASVRLLKKIEADLGVSLFDRMPITYKSGDRVETVSKSEFEKLVHSGSVNKDTVVFNNLIQTYPELATAWEVPLKDSWHARVFL